MFETRGFDGRDEVFRGNEGFSRSVFLFVVGVAEDDGYNVERMRFYPSRYFLQVGFDCAGVEEVTARVAVVESSVDVVDLAL